MKIVPLNNYIIVEKQAVEQKTASGIYLPETALEQEKNQKSEGIVYATNEDAPVKIGDLVVYKKWSADEIKMDGKDYYFITNEDLMARIEE